MLDPFTLAALVVAVCGGVGAIIKVVILALKAIQQWFHTHQAYFNRNMVRFSVLERMRNGRYRTSLGIFDENTDKVVAGQVLESEGLDDDLARVHRNKQLAIYK